MAATGMSRREELQQLVDEIVQTKVMNASQDAETPDEETENVAHVAKNCRRTAESLRVAHPDPRNATSWSAQLGREIAMPARGEESQAMAAMFDRAADLLSGKE
jgi:hypothetical protein